MISLSSKGLLRVVKLAAILAISFAMSHQNANATMYTFDWNPSLGTGTLSNGGAGVLNSIHSTFDTISKHLTWTANFGPNPGTSTVPTNGFSLVLSPGPNPKGTPGELALLFFDASTPTNLRLTSYGYNGANSLTSITTNPDRIQSLTNASPNTSLIYQTESNGTKTMGFSIDASAIQSHVPNPGGVNPWTGVAYGSLIGEWFHWYSGLQTEYNSNHFLDDVSFSHQGYLDGANMHTVPEPTTVAGAITALTGLIALKRRKA